MVFLLNTSASPRSHRVWYPRLPWLRRPLQDIELLLGARLEVVEHDDGFVRGRWRIGSTVGEAKYIRNRPEHVPSMGVAGVALAGAGYAIHSRRLIQYICVSADRRSERLGV